MLQRKVQILFCNIATKGQMMIEIMYKYVYVLYWQSKFLHHTNCDFRQKSKNIKSHMHNVEITEILSDTVW